MSNYRSQDAREIYWLLSQTVDAACYHVGLFRTEADAKDAVKDEISQSGWMNHEGGWFEAMHHLRADISYHVLRMPLLTPIPEEPETAGHAATGEAGTNNRPAPAIDADKVGRQRYALPEFGPHTRFDAAEIISDGYVLAVIAEPERRRADGGTQAPDWDEGVFELAVRAFAESRFTDSQDDFYERVCIQFDPGRDQARAIVLDGTRF